MCKQLGGCAVVSSWCKACKTNSNIKTQVFLVSTAKFCPRIRRNKTTKTKVANHLWYLSWKSHWKYFALYFAECLISSRSHHLAMLPMYIDDVYRFGALVVVPILTHLGQGAVYRHHDDRPWNFRISSHYSEWTLIACAKHGDSSAKLRGCRMPTISSTILPINMSWRYGRTCQRADETSEDHASGQHLRRMDVHITSKCVSHDNQEFILNRETGLSSCGAPRGKFSFYFEPGDCQQTIITVSQARQVTIQHKTTTILIAIILVRLV